MAQPSSRSPTRQRPVLAGSRWLPTYRRPPDRGGGHLAHAERLSYRRHRTPRLAPPRSRAGRAQPGDDAAAGAAVPDAGRPAAAGRNRLLGVCHLAAVPAARAGHLHDGAPVPARAGQLAALVRGACPRIAGGVRRVRGLPVGGQPHPVRGPRAVALHVAAGLAVLPGIPVVLGARGGAPGLAQLQALPGPGAAGVAARGAPGARAARGPQGPAAPAFPLQHTQCHLDARAPRPDSAPTR